MNFDLTKKFSIGDIQQVDTDLDFVNLNFDKQAELFDQLKELLWGQDNQVLYDHRYDYTRLFVLLAWNRLTSLSRDEVVWLFHNTVVEAILFDIDVWKELMWYCNGLFANDVDDLEAFYKEIKNAVLQSEAVLGQLGENFVLKEFVTEVQKNERQNVDTLQSSELYTRVEQALFAKDHAEFIKAYVEKKPNEVVRELVNLINFFLGVKPEDIHYVMNAFVSSTAGDVRDVAASQPVETPVQTPEQIIQQKPVEMSTETTSSHSHYHEVHEELEIMYRYDSQGELQPIEEVLAKLSDFAQKYNDPQIEELYYFDEGEGKFVWNSELLK